MIVDIARFAVQALGALICVLCLWGMVAPRSLIALVKGAVGSYAGFLFAVAIRIVLGAALLTTAQTARFPAAFTVLGWIAILAAIGLLTIGQSRARKLVDRVGRMSPPAIRAMLVLGLAFGVFLVLTA